MCNEFIRKKRIKGAIATDWEALKGEWHLRVTTTNRSFRNLCENWSHFLYKKNNYFYFLDFLATPRGMWDLNSLTRDWILMTGSLGISPNCPMWIWNPRVSTFKWGKKNHLPFFFFLISHKDFMKRIERFKMHVIIHKIWRKFITKELLSLGGGDYSFFLDSIFSGSWAFSD